MSPKVRFYGEQELNESVQSSKRKPYREKEKWEKYLDNENRKEKRRNKKIKEHEMSYEYIDQMNGSRKV